MVVFEIIVVLEIAAIVGMIGVAFAPAQVWAIFELKPPAWTRAARLAPALREPQQRDHSAPQGALASQAHANRSLLSFGEMG
jgi:hypothetical protein